MAPNVQEASDYRYSLCIVLFYLRRGGALTNEDMMNIWAPEEIDEDELGVWIRPTKEPTPSSFAEYNEELEKEQTARVERLTLHLYMLDKRIEEREEQTDSWQASDSRGLDWPADWKPRSGENSGHSSAAKET
jgi:hypothetical protein